MTIKASTMLAVRMPTPLGGPENQPPMTGTPPSNACKGGWIWSANNGANTNNPQMPYTMEGIPASNSIAVHKGRRSQSGQVSVRNSAIPKLTGTAISKASTDVVTVP